MGLMLIVLAVMALIFTVIAIRETKITKELTRQTNESINNSTTELAREGRPFQVVRKNREL